MKRSGVLLLLWAAGNVAAAQLTVAVTLAMDTGTLSDLAAAVARVNDVVPARLAVRGIPLRAGWEKDAYWQATTAERQALKAELTAAWADFSEQLPAAGVEIDPAFFRRYRITDAPVFVLEGEKDSVGGEGCETERPALVIRGNVTAGYAVTEMVKAAKDAPVTDPDLNAALQRLEALSLW